MLTLAFSAALLQTQPHTLQHVRQALMIASGSAWKETTLMGTASYYGVPHEYTFVSEPDGKFVQTFKGPVGETFGYDGKTFWRVDRSRGVQKLDFEDRDRLLALSLILSSGWLNTDAPVKVSEDGYTLHLKLKTSGQEETVKIDKETWLPVEASFPVSSGVMRVKLASWKAAGDRLVPAQIDITEGGLTDSASAEKVEAAEPDTTQFQLPDWKADDMSFDAAKPPAVESKRAISGHILVHPLVNGKEAGWFILDSGAEVMVIDKGVADEMKLDSVGHLPLTGVGGTVQSAFRPVDEFTLGPATMKKILFTELDLSQIGRILGIKLGGIVGADFMRRSIVSLDLNTAAVEVHPREGFGLTAAQWLPVRFSTGNPAVEATIDGAPKAWYRFDTGANGTVTLHAPFVRKYKLLNGKKTTVTGSGGVGGMVTAQMGKVKWFELGGHRFQNPFVQFATSTQGAFSEVYLAGNIGQDFMKPFQVVLDFSGYRLALIPRAANGR